MDLAQEHLPDPDKNKNIATWNAHIGLQLSHIMPIWPSQAQVGVDLRKRFQLYLADGDSQYYSKI